MLFFIQIRHFLEIKNKGEQMKWAELANQKISLWGMKSSPPPNFIHSCLLSSILSHISFGHLTYFGKKIQSLSIGVLVLGLP